MQFIEALSLAPDARTWLAETRRPRVLHVFEHVCNLVNDRGGVLSLVPPRVGNGPFNLVLASEPGFSELVDVGSVVSVEPDQLKIGSMSVSTAVAQLWNPRPDWDSLHGSSDVVLAELRELPVRGHTPLVPAAHFAELANAVAAFDVSAAVRAAAALAGLGPGLTPAGDDVLLGAMLAGWILHSHERAAILARSVCDVAAPLTTTLSAALLRSAAMGEAGSLWQRFFSALSSRDASESRRVAAEMLAVGETSGADALAGFSNTFSDWAKAREKVT